MAETKQVFISHDSEDAGFAHRLANDLRRRGVRVWIAPESIHPGEDWVEAIERGLRESSHMLVVLTQAAVTSKWVKLETNAAIALERKGQIKVIPLDVKACTAPILLSTFQMVSFRRGYDVSFRQLVNRLGLQRTSPRPSPKAVTPPISKKPSRPSAAPTLRYDGFYRRKVIVPEFYKKIKKMMNRRIPNDFFHFLAFHEDGTVRLDSALDDKHPSMIFINPALEALLKDVSKTQHTVFPQDDYPKTGLIGLSRYTVQGKDIEFSFVYHEENPPRISRYKGNPLC